MKSVCAWCFSNAPQEEETEPITHGICSQHMEQIQRETITYWRKEGKEIKEFEKERETKNTTRN